MQNDLLCSRQTKWSDNSTVEIPDKSSSSTEAAAAVIVLLGCFAAFAVVVCSGLLLPPLLLEAAALFFLVDILCTGGLHQRQGRYQSVSLSLINLLAGETMSSRNVPFSGDRYIGTVLHKRKGKEIFIIHSDYTSPIVAVKMWPISEKKNRKKKCFSRPRL